MSTRRTMLLCILWSAVLIVAQVARAEPPSYPAGNIARGKHGMVVAVSQPATEVGISVLKRGGNSVDAAVAVAFALAVTYPQAGNIGGGGFMMVCPGDGGEPTCIEYRETAPSAATATMFDLNESKLGPKVVGVPGPVRGLALAHARFGKLPWSDLLQPAVHLAQEGFALDAAVAKSLNEVLADKKSQAFTEFLRVYGKCGADGKRAPWNEGDILVQPELARTLAVIAEKGAVGFYSGRVAEQIVAEMKAGGGVITQADLAGYQAKARKPIHGTFRGYDVYGPPPPSSGGTCLVEMLNVLENFELKKWGRTSPQTCHVLLETMRRAFVDRARHLGDGDCVEIPSFLTSKEYAKRLAAEIDLEKATPSENLASDIPLAGEGPSTTHFSIIDEQGIAVANTYTLEASYGSRVVVRGAGFLLNNEMGDFNWKPGHTDRTGNIGTPPNVIAPGKRMLSSQTPTIVCRDGKVVLVTGSPGGRTIINTSLQIVLGVLEFGEDLPTAVSAPRWHHQWLPDTAKFEAAVRPEFAGLVEELRSRGHKIEQTAKQGDAHSIWVDPKTGEYVGVADTRISGSARGF